ncbi:hypothetical protein RhiirB3_433557 [Rhizophagus irregularis]|nr:hypothetical protein RhiirB3_433557 [Rhizophagus irregularis]
MAFSSITNLSKAFHEGDDLDTAVNRALYYELVNHTFRKYSSFSLTEEDIARTVEKASGDGEYLTNLLMEHHEALSTFSIALVKDGKRLQKFMQQQMTSPKQIPDASKSVEDQPMEIEILEAPKMPKHQLKVAAQQEEPIKNLSTTATPFTPKGKQKRVLYADMVKQDPKDDVSRSSSPSPSGKQPAATFPKTISTVMTGYVPVNKNLTQEITVYDIPSTWSQLDMLNHLKAWVSIELNQEATRLWNDGAWTAPLGGLPVRWFLANWDLKQKKEWERFQAVLKGVPALVNTATLYPENPAHSILAPIGCKAFKLIQDRVPAS